MYDKYDHCIPGQNGMWVKFEHFWHGNDGERWYRRNIFEINPWARHFLLNEFAS